MMNAVLADLLREIDRPQQTAAAPAVWRRATVTAVVSGGVQTTLTGDAVVRYLAWYSPAVDDDVELIQQGADVICLGKLA